MSGSANRFPLFPLSPHLISSPPTFKTDRLPPGDIHPQALNFLTGYTTTTKKTINQGPRVVEEGWIGSLGFAGAPTTIHKMANEQTLRELYSTPCDKPQEKEHEKEGMYVSN